MYDHTRETASKRVDPSKTADGAVDEGFMEKKHERPGRPLDVEVQDGSPQRTRTADLYRVKVAL
jgi:hypothetical protein